MRIPTRPRRTRRGAIVLLTAAMLTAVFAFFALTLDLGYVAVTRTQLQAAADAAALAAAADLLDGLGPAPRLTPAAAQAQARESAQTLANLHRTLDRPAVRLDPQSDVSFGRAAWDAAAGRWRPAAGTGPLNLVRVQVSRGATGGDGPLPLLFAPLLGHRSARIDVGAEAAVLAAAGFRIPPGSPRTAPLLPFACDVASWEALERGQGRDDYQYDPATKSVGRGWDGVLELDIYPGGKSSLPSGNRGIVSLGAPASDTPGVRRWILHGANAGDLAHFGGTLGNDQCPVELDGVPGMKATLQQEVEAILGQPRVLPLFSKHRGNGTKAVYTIERFVGVRVVAVRLTGNTKHLVVQPAAVVDDTAVGGEAVSSYFYQLPQLVQ